MPQASAGRLKRPATRADAWRRFEQLQEQALYVDQSRSRTIHSAGPGSPVQLSQSAPSAATGGGAEPRRPSSFADERRDRGLFADVSTQWSRDPATNVPSTRRAARSGAADADDSGARRSRLLQELMEDAASEWQASSYAAASFCRARAPRRKHMSERRACAQVGQRRRPRGRARDPAAVRRCRRGPAHGGADARRRRDTARARPPREPLL